MGVFEMQGDIVAVTNEDQCIVCRSCEASCPVNAIIVED
jgi:NAD-dependent dihydropyrimidine dehydrogenase PreA subunit